MDGPTSGHHHQYFAWTPNQQPSLNTTSSSSEATSEQQQLEHVDDHHHEEHTGPSSSSVPQPPAPKPPLDPETLPGGRRSPASISLRAFLLGQTFSLGVVLTLHLLLNKQNPLWRLPFFLALLSLFHFLEFWTTARFNTRYATVSAFLLSSNGKAYNLAQVAAVLECLLVNVWLTPRPSTPSSSSSSSLLLPVLGVLMAVVGQTTRSLAMAQAGTNFNHRVQTKRSEEHRLVKTGIYAYLRHPSYFGFFWWALGAQLVLGNQLCFVVYAVVLWRFFKVRIRSKSRCFLPASTLVLVYSGKQGGVRKADHTY